VIVLDVELPDEDGVTTIKRLRECGFDGKILVLTERLDGPTVLECVRAGVDGYLEKAQGLRAVGSSIIRVATGERLIPHELEQRAVMELGRYARVAREGSEVASSLTPRELQILHAISEGLTMRSIANRLGISPRTVETHAAKLYRKLGARTRLQAVTRAASLGLIEL
jgi:two-component system nitrate/nitrite response regulator NarL